MIKPIQTMERLISNINDNLKIVFDEGKFDNWCVYISKNGKRYAPKDLEYFSELKRLALKYSALTIYTDFLKIYKFTSSAIESSVLNTIYKISKHYQKGDQSAINIWFTVIYAGMIAEENKQSAVLKKRIKHLGIYQLLMLNQSPEEAANFSKGRKWQEIDKLMKEYGI